MRNFCPGSGQNFSGLSYHPLDLSGRETLPVVTSKVTCLKAAQVGQKQWVAEGAKGWLPRARTYLSTPL